MKMTMGITFYIFISQTKCYMYMLPTLVGTKGVSADYSSVVTQVGIIDMEQI